MAQLTESNWESSFQNVISNCKTKGRKLEGMVCKKSGTDMVDTYKKFEKDATNKYTSYKSTPVVLNAGRKTRSIISMEHS